MNTPALDRTPKRVFSMYAQIPAWKWMLALVGSSSLLILLLMSYHLSSHPWMRYAATCYFDCGDTLKVYSVMEHNGVCRVVAQFFKCPCNQEWGHHIFTQPAKSLARVSCGGQRTTVAHSDTTGTVFECRCPSARELKIEYQHGQVAWDLEELSELPPPQKNTRFALCSSSLRFSADGNSKLQFAKIKSWAEHHHRIGFELIYLYFRNSTEMKAWHEEHTEDWIIEVHFPLWSLSVDVKTLELLLPGDFDQEFANAHCLNNLRHRVEWTGLWDTDEFLTLGAGKDVSGLIEAHSTNTSALSISNIPFAPSAEHPEQQGFSQTLQLGGACIGDPCHQFRSSAECWTQFAGALKDATHKSSNKLEIKEQFLLRHKLLVKSEMVEWIYVHWAVGVSGDYVAVDEQVAFMKHVGHDCAVVNGQVAFMKHTPGGLISLPFCNPNDVETRQNHMGQLVEPG